MSKRGMHDYICVPKPLDEYELQGRENPLKDYYHNWRGNKKQYNHTMGEYLRINSDWNIHKEYPTCPDCQHKYIKECLLCAAYPPSAR